jgi:hypothetical protein
MKKRMDFLDVMIAFYFYAINANQIMKKKQIIPLLLN